MTTGSSAMSEMEEAFLRTAEGSAAWLYGFLSAFAPVDSEEIDDAPGTAKVRYDSALAMLRRLACLDEVGDGVIPAGHLLPAPGLSPLWWATRGAISCGGWHAKASARALANLLFFAEQLNSDDAADE